MRRTAVDRIDPKIIEHVVAAVSLALEKPSSDLPSTRCLSRPYLIAWIGRLIREQEISAHRAPSATVVLEHLERAMLVRAIPLENPAPKLGAKRLYAIGMGVEPLTLHPFEILQAHAPSGVVCYMSALEAHALTTQPITHHHIAVAETAPSRLKQQSNAGANRLPAMSNGDKSRHPLGREQFIYQGVPYYQTRREPKYLASHKIRMLSDRSRYRVTTLEQTLLDTLHRPSHCGGPAVVFEAWDSGADRLSADRMSQLLTALAEPELARRALYMLHRVGIDNVEVHDLPHTLDGPPQSLLHGVPYQRLDARWNLLVP
jgi:hypothetical protein